MVMMKVVGGGEGRGMLGGRGRGARNTSECRDERTRWSGRGLFTATPVLGDVTVMIMSHSVGVLVYTSGDKLPPCWGFRPPSVRPVHARTGRRKVRM